MGKYLRAFYLVTPLLVTFICVAAGSGTPPEPDGAALFKKQCSMCHGADGKGFPVMKTPDLTDPKWQESHKDDKELIEFIRTGKKPMPPFPVEKVSDEELKAIIAHIRSLNTKEKSD